MPTAGGLALHRQRLTVQWLSGGEVALGVQQRAEAADGGERARMPIAEGLARRLQRLAVQRLSCGEVALGLQQRAEVVALGLQQLRGERAQCGACGHAIRALNLEPCTQKLDAQRIAVLAHPLATAVGCVLLWARAPPLLEAVLVDPLGGAAAGTRLHERAVLFICPAQPARLLLDHPPSRVASLELLLVPGGQ
eukprot:scaffold75857_cov64-Phaeocystis_antarctica.AAC.2